MLAHQDAGDVVAYKRAGWWGDTTVGDYVAALGAGTPRRRRARRRRRPHVVVGVRRARSTRLATTLAATGFGA